MSIIKRMSAVSLVPAVLGLGTVAFSTVVSGQSGSPSVRCEIQVAEHGDSVALKGVVITKTAIQGSYTLHVSKSGGAGHSDINQSGDFSAAQSGATTLGEVTLGGGGSYVAKLKVTSQGRSYECTERVGGAL